MERTFPLMFYSKYLFDTSPWLPKVIRIARQPLWSVTSEKIESESKKCTEKQGSACSSKEGSRGWGGGRETQQIDSQPGAASDLCCLVVRLPWWFGELSTCHRSENTGLRCAAQCHNNCDLWFIAKTLLKFTIIQFFPTKWTEQWTERLLSWSTSSFIIKVAVKLCLSCLQNLTNCRQAIMNELTNQIDVSAFTNS